jgi:hypothetical protein
MAMTDYYTRAAIPEMVAAINLLQKQLVSCLNKIV